jgi:hypothetical protein
LKQARRAYYRECTEGIDLREADALEKEIRHKMEQKAAGPPGSYYLKTCFRFFDQDSKGGIDLEAFKQVGAYVDAWCLSPFSTPHVPPLVTSPSITATSHHHFSPPPTTH